MLKDKIALVTGASRGIGRQIAITLASYGATVIVNYNGSKDAAEAVVEQITQQGGNAKAVQCSVAEAEACKEMIDSLLADYGRIDILVNNAGITKDNLLLKITEENFNSVMATNLNGTFHTCKYLYRSFMKQKSGRIINLSSVSGIHGNAGQTNYSASKAGVIGFTKALAKELASRNITVNAVAPGYIDTDMTQAMSEDAKEAIRLQIPLKRVGTPEDIAEMVAFLASDRAAYITGQVLSIDGGMTI